MERIMKAGRDLRWIVGGLLVLAPVIFVVVFAEHGPLGLLAVPANVAVSLADASLLDAIVLSLLAAATPVIYWLAFLALYRLAASYGRGGVLTAGAAARLEQVGWLLFATDFVRMAQTAVTGPLLAWMGLSGHFLNVELQLGMSIVGLFIVLVARIMGLAATFEAERRLTI